MPSDIQLKRYLIIICLFIMLACLMPSAAALPANYTARENPANITASSGQVDLKTLAIMADLYRGLGNIAVDMNQSNFDKAKIDYASFKDLYDNNKDVFNRLFDSDQDALAAINATDLTVNDIQVYLNNVHDYNETYRLYNASLAAGDTSNATAYAIKVVSEYRKLNASYNDLKNSSYVAMDRLDASNQQSVNASLLLSFMGTTDQTMAVFSAERSEIKLQNGDYYLTLVPSENEASIGDTVTYDAILKRDAGTPVEGANVVLYANDRVVGSSITDSSGTCAIPYKIPDDLTQSDVSVHAEYTHSGQAMLPAVSDMLVLHVHDEPAVLSSSIAAHQATFGDRVAVNGSLVALKGFPARNCPVDIYLNGIRLGRALTDDDGAYSFSFPITDHIPAGNCNVYAVYRQTSGYIFSSASSPSDHLEVTPQNTSITMAVSTVRFTAGDIAAINGTIQSEKGLPVDNATVLFMMDGRQIGANMTDQNGSYRIKAAIPYDSVSGDHSLYAVYEPANSSLSGSSSDRALVHVQGVTTVIKVNGTQPVLFLNDTLNVTGSLRTEAGLPVRGQAITVRVSDSIGGTVTTDDSGNFNYSRTVNGYDPAGLYDISVFMQVPGNSSSSTSSASGPVLILPVDKALAMTAIAVLLAALFVVVLLANAGMSIGRLMDLATGRSRLEADLVDEPQSEQPALAEQETIPAAPPSYGLESIGATIASGGFVNAAISMYMTARKIAVDHGVKVRDSDTHREFYRAMAESRPGLADPLRPIVDTYERMRYGHGDSSVEDMQKAFNGLKAVESTFTDETGGRKA